MGEPREPEECLFLEKDGWEDVAYLEVSVTLCVFSYLSTKSFMLKIRSPTF